MVMCSSLVFNYNSIGKLFSPLVCDFFVMKSTKVKTVFNLIMVKL